MKKTAYQSTAGKWEKADRPEGTHLASSRDCRINVKRGRARQPALFTLLKYIEK